MLSTLSTLRPSKFKPRKINPLPAPGAPAKIIALGPFNCSIKY